MAKNIKKLFALILAVAMVMSLSVSAFAADDEGNTDKTAEWVNKTDPTLADVRLSVPGDVEIKGADIVFVVDKSSCEEKSKVRLQDMFNELAAAQKQSGTDIKVGVIQFNYTDHVEVPLTKLTTENAGELLKGLSKKSGGTNIESGLLTAKAMLDDDKTVPAENKYVILISDGLTWVFDDEYGNPCTILHEYSEGENKDYPAGTISAGTHGYTYARGVKYVELPAGYSWAAYWRQIQEWVEADNGKYDFLMASNYSEQPFKDSLKTDEAKEKALTAAEGQNHAVNMDRAMYDAWLAYTDLQDAGYNCYVNNVTVEGSKYSGSNGDHFMNMLAGDQKAVDFESIQNSIIHSVASESYVEDYMGYEAGKYNFDFVTDPETIVLTVNGVKYVTDEVAAEAGYDHSYTFTAPVEGAVPTFWLDYTYGEDGTEDEMFRWTFGEAVSAFYPASLDYQVELVEVLHKTGARQTLVYTNQEATLYPKDSNGKNGTPEEFPIPELIIKLPTYTVTYEYVGTVPAGADRLPSTKDYPAGADVTIAGQPDEVDGYYFYGWNDPCNALVGGKMPAHDVTLTGYWLPLNNEVDPPIGIKTDKETTGYDYEVTIAVPGDGEEVKVHDEIILIIDGSYSGDDEWDQMKENIIQIGEKVLGGAGRTHMTVMTFGMGDNIVVEDIETVAELEDMLPSLPGGLLYGRSSTNCEAGFAGAEKYIIEHASDHNDVEVVFISDGGINTDEHTDIFDDPSKNWLSSKNDLYVAELARVALMTWVDEDDNNRPYNSCDYIINGWAEPSPAFEEVFGTKSAAEVKAEYFDDTYEEFKTNYEIYLQWANAVYDNVYEFAGLERGAAYPISVVERAFVSYDEYNDTRVQDLFYAYLSGRSYSDKSNRTIAAAEKLADNMLVDELYLVQYANDGRAWWMKEIVNGNYYHADSVSSMIENVGGLLTELSGTNYTNVVVTDYMSKWVILDTDSISIVNDTTGVEIWNAVDGWQSETDRPTTKEPPVVVELVNPADYADGGDDVIGNMNGVIYKLTWYVKDDCLLRTDNYSLHYIVTVDTAEEGFIPGKEYPANGNTYVEYEKDGSNDIKVPNVSIPAYTVTYLNGKVELQKTDSLLTGSQIPGCSAPADYESNGYAYTFTGWQLTKGIEGANGTVGNTDLVYQAVFARTKIETPTYTVTYIDRDEEVQFTEDLSTGDEIPGCKAPADYVYGIYFYEFDGWKLIDGIEGTNGTVGTTDLVYEATYTRTKIGKPSTPVGPSREDEDDDIEINDDEIPLADIPAVFSDDHFAYIIGRDDGLVHPEANITRAEVATIFFRLLAEDVRAALMTDVNNFSDVDKGQWYNHAISTLSSMGIVRGRDNGTYYDPDAFITRAEFAAIAARFDPAGNPEGVFFSDIAGHWAEQEIIIAANNGWVEGYNGLFRPDDYITRAEAMTLVNRVLHRLPETEHDLLDYMVIWPDNMDVNAWYYLAVQEATNSHFYVRKENPIYETWTEFREPYDWSLLEY